MSRNGDFRNDAWLGLVSHDMFLSELLVLMSLLAAAARLHLHFIMLQPPTHAGRQSIIRAICTWATYCKADRPLPVYASHVICNSLITVEACQLLDLTDNKSYFHLFTISPVSEPWVLKIPLVFWNAFTIPGTRSTSDETHQGLNSQEFGQRTNSFFKTGLPFTCLCVLKVECHGMTQGAVRHELNLIITEIIRKDCT